MLKNHFAMLASQAELSSKSIAFFLLFLWINFFFLSFVFIILWMFRFSILFALFSIGLHSLDVQHLIRPIMFIYFASFLFFFFFLMPPMHNKMKYLMHSHGTSIDWLAGYGNDIKTFFLFRVIFWFYFQFIKNVLSSFSNSHTHTESAFWLNFNFFRFFDARSLSSSSLLFNEHKIFQNGQKSIDSYQRDYHISSLTRRLFFFWVYFFDFLSGTHKNTHTQN